MPPKPAQRSPIPVAFTAKKDDILASLAIPDADYTDASPKGSIDVPIRGLIDRINALEGVVTTSSCSGRISVFLEATKADHGGDLAEADGVEEAGPDYVIDQVGGRVGEFNDDTDSLEKESSKQVPQRAVPGGKGNGGRWLFVSHEPLLEDVLGAEASLSKALGLSSHECTDRNVSSHSKQEKSRQSRLIRFQFEPMILHIMTASLHYAKSVLAAAINSGFRESGVQSLKNLDDVNAFPMVAVRTSGLALESLIGCSEDGEDGRQVIMPLVSEDFLRILVRIGNERFVTNRERITRFEKELFAGRDRESQWESAEARRERKRKAGLARQVAIQRSLDGQEQQSL